MQVKEIEQQFLRVANLPQVELRSTRCSTQGYKSHSHAEFSIGYLHSGSTCLTCDGKEQQITQGDLVIIEPGKVHACNPIDGGSRGYHMLYIDAQWCLDWLSALFEKPVSKFCCEQTVIRDPKVTEPFLTLVDLLQRGYVSEASAKLDHLAVALLAPYCAPVDNSGTSDKRAVRIKQQLLSDLSNPPALDQLAEAEGCTREALIRLFKRHYGITPIAFASNARIEHAKLLLRQGDAIVDFAQDIGFADQSQFHRTFVNYTASTPRQYQQAGSISDNNH